ncbi:hypothetical protein Rsub_05852 [Raphidocelis subcapitata]|uniref:Uncharacterized protein n=1 Tax=Raphidocelis subcapitata TaxID=307507 RepID=A0A2V0P5H6_9CHLO|nr:hypothetical protein Rsub_05852 [Raphidocelis subcapitata]|eukprot:GBF93123.1 hypothetical protein Rsub_05852 [Raphidocelis subcapitata]
MRGHRGQAGHRLGRQRVAQSRKQGGPVWGKQNGPEEACALSGARRLKCFVAAPFTRARARGARRAGLPAHERALARARVWGPRSGPRALPRAAARARASRRGSLRVSLVVRRAHVACALSEL